MLRRSLRLRQNVASLTNPVPKQGDLELDHDAIDSTGSPNYDTVDCSDSHNKHHDNTNPIYDYPNTPVTSKAELPTHGLTFARRKHQDDSPDFDPVTDQHNLNDLDPDYYPDLDLPNKHNLDDDLDLNMNDVRRRDYRANCLGPNGIYFQHPSDTLPHQVALLTDQVLTPLRPHPPAMLADMMHELDVLGTQGCSEASIQQCLFRCLFPTTLPLELSTSYQGTIARHLIPACPDAPYALPLPRPDILYGYNTWKAFTKAQQTILNRIHPENWSYAQATPEVSFPFFSVEFKAAAGTGGNLWDAANQCAGGAAACLQALGQLNTALGAAGCQGLLPSLHYSLAIDNNLGQLYASWKNDGYLIFNSQRVASFLLSDVQHFSRLCACVAAILEWGATTRLQDICVAADYIWGAKSQK